MTAENKLRNRLKEFNLQTKTQLPLSFSPSDIEEITKAKEAKVKADKQIKTAKTVKARSKGSSRLTNKKRK